MKQTFEENVFVPDQTEGKSLDLETSIKCKDETEAISIFKRARNRLLHPDIWHHLTGTWSAVFKLVAREKQEASREARVGDHIRINIPGPGNVAGRGYDWVQVERIANWPDKKADESFGMTVRPAANPEQSPDATAHFFHGNATSTFLLKKNDLVVTACYHGRNELPNTDDVSVQDKLRNTVVATLALTGISELQWKAFLEGLLK